MPPQIDVFLSVRIIALQCSSKVSVGGGCLLLDQRPELRDAERRYDRLALVEEFVDRPIDVAIREVDDHVLIAAAFRVGLAPCLAGELTADRADFLQHSIRPVDPHLAL